MKEFKGRVIVPGTCSAEALVSRGGFNTLASFQMAIMFNKKGVIIIEKEGLDEDAVMNDALEAGASDFQADEDVFEIYTEPDDFSAVRDDLEAKKYEFVSAEIEMVPDTYTTIENEELVTKMNKLLEMLDDNDDVQNVWHNWDAPEEPDED